MPGVVGGSYPSSTTGGRFRKSSKTYNDTRGAGSSFGRTCARFSTGIVKPEDVDAWIQDLPAIYPVEVIDCRTYGRRGEMSACVDPELIVIRSRLELHRNDLRSALR